MSTVTTYQAGSQGSKPMKTPTPVGTRHDNMPRMFAYLFQPLVKLEKNYWVSSLGCTDLLHLHMVKLTKQRYVTKRWVSFLWRASLWPVPVTFVIATVFLGKSSLAEPIEVVRPETDQHQTVALSSLLHSCHVPSSSLSTQYWPLDAPTSQVRSMIPCPD